MLAVLERRNRRAISPIIATILLIVITIAGALIVWTMLAGFGNKGNTSGVSIVTADAQLQPDGKTVVLKVAVKNTGTTLLTGSMQVKFDNGTAIYLKTDGTYQTGTATFSLYGGQTIQLATSAPIKVGSPPISVTFTASFTDPTGKVVVDIKGVQVTTA